GWRRLERSEFTEAQGMLADATTEAPSDVEATLGLTVAHAARRHFAEASTMLARLASIAPTDWEPAIAKVRSTLESLEGGARHALVVGIDTYQSPAVPALRGAVNDARAMASVLEERCGFPAANIRVLLNHEATREAILAAFGDLTNLKPE